MPLERWPATSGRGLRTAGNRVAHACRGPGALLAAAALSAGAAPKIDAVFFAQTHVQPPDSPYFKLVGDRDALIKVHVVAPGGESAPPVQALLSVGDARTNLVLRGPGKLPESISVEPGRVVHRFDDSFTARIPKEWVRPGLRVTVRAGGAARSIRPRVGAPTVVNMTMFDIHFFAWEDRDYPEGWREELEAKWPVAKLNVQRVPGFVFPELVVPPREGFPAVRCRSPQEYQARTGSPFDGEQVTALQWKDALQAAGGQTRVSLYFINIHNASAGGDAWDFGGVGRAGNTGILHHELGHALGRPHLIDEPEYPYRDVLYGIVGKGPHVGPVWGFDPRPGLPGAPAGLPYFIPPVVQSNAVGQTPGNWKRDPMQGGGSGDQEKGFFVRMFSDYSAHKMQEYLEDKVAVWDPERKEYSAWNDRKGRYSRKLKNDGVALPVGPDTEVISLMAGVSAVTPDAILVYPPVGPYVSGLIKLFDPSVPADRALAARVFAPEDGCDVSLRVEQGGKTSVYMLPIGWRPQDDPRVPWLYTTRAVNVPAAAGKVTRVELLLTPDAEKNGLPAEPKVLGAWQAQGASEGGKDR